MFFEVTATPMALAKCRADKSTYPSIEEFLAKSPRRSVSFTNPSSPHNTETAVECELWIHSSVSHHTKALANCSGDAFIKALAQFKEDGID